MMDEVSFKDILQDRTHKYRRTLIAVCLIAVALYLLPIRFDELSLFGIKPEEGYAVGQAVLSLMYFRGQGVAQDYVQAHMWSNLAASRFSSSETEERDRAVRQRDFAASKMTPEQIAEAQKLAREWKPK